VHRAQFGALVFGIVESGKIERALWCSLADLLLLGELFPGVQHREENDKYLIFPVP